VNSLVAQVQSDGSPNIWDDGYPSGGNYWSDYSTKYPSATEVDNSGIWNTPYVIDANNTDHYPLMRLYAPNSLSVGKTVVGQGFSVNMSFALANYNAYPKTINVTVYANTTDIGTETVNNISNGTSSLLNFSWNTTGFAYGNYALWAVDAYDNCTAGNVAVTIPGDINGGGPWFPPWLADLVALAKAYGSHRANYDYPGEPASPNWNPNADINGDGVVNLLDLVILAQHYGEQYTIYEQIRDAVMTYIKANHPETAQYMQNLSWTGGRITLPGLVGAGWYSYASGDWNFTMSFPVIPNTIYSITANYTTPTQTIVAWQGTWQNGTITEVSYKFNP
jgi:hypothetical protein